MDTLAVKWYVYSPLNEKKKIQQNFKGSTYKGT